MTNFLVHLLMYNISAAGHDREIVAHTLHFTPFTCVCFLLTVSTSCHHDSLVVSCSWQYTAVEVRTTDAEELT